MFLLRCGVGTSLVQPGAADLVELLARCRRDEADAWEELPVWVRSVSRRALAGFRSFTAADREDVLAGAMERLIPVIRKGGIRATKNGEVFNYVQQTIRRVALNVVRSTRSPELFDDHEVGVIPDQERVALVRAARRLIETWPPEEQFIFLQKAYGVSAACIKAELEQAPYTAFMAVETVDTRYHRLRTRLREQLDGRKAGRTMR